MTITPAQRITIIKLWNQVCKDRGWKAGDRSLRLATLSEIAGRNLSSMDDIERVAECTRVMNGLKVMLGVSIKAGLEVGDSTLNKARNYRHVIMNEITPCLALYVADVAVFITRIMQDKNRWWKIDRPAREITLEDLDAKPIFKFVREERREFPSSLEQLLFTLQARLNEKRKAAGDTIHDMKLKARLECGCAECARRKFLVQAVAASAVPVAEEQPF
jgi:hypothetical protein